MMKGHEPTPPALAEFRHVIEFEPDDRALLWFSYPTTGGKHRSPMYGSELELDHHTVFPPNYRLDALAQLWERTFPQHPAFEKDGLLPRAPFATYMIEVALLEACEALPELLRTRRGQPIVVVLADGWNHSGMSADRIELYQNIKASVLDTTTVGDFKRKFPVWRERFYDLCPN